MSILEDFYSQQDSPDVPPTGVMPTSFSGGIQVQQPFSSTTVKGDTKTTKTQITPDETTQIIPANNVTTNKNSTTTTQFKENTQNTLMSQPEWENKTGAREVYARLGMQPPKPNPNADRNKKIAGYQAIGEALRNVVDATYGKQKAIIIPHKSYLGEFANQIAKDDANEELKFKEYYKALEAQGKALADNYMKYYTKASERAYDKVSTTKGDETQINPKKVITTKTKKGNEISYQSGGTSKTTGTKTGTVYGGDGNKSTISKEIKLPDGSVYVLDDKNLRIASDIASRYRGGKSYGEAGDALYKKILNGEELTPDEHALFIQSAVNTNPELAKDMSRPLNIQQTQVGTGKMAGEVVKENSKTNPIKQSKQPKQKGALRTGYDNSKEQTAPVKAKKKNTYGI